MTALLAVGMAAAVVAWGRLRAGRAAALRLSKDRLLEARNAHALPSQKLAHVPTPLCIVQGDGNYLVDDAGARYLDSRNNVASIGHQHPRWLAAVCAQLARTNTNARYLHPLREALVARLLALSPRHLTHVLLLNSGSEANDAALRLARAKSGSRHVIALEGGYHGVTCATLDASPYKWPAQRPDSLTVIGAPADAADARWGDVDAAVARFPGASLIVESAQSVGGCRLFAPGWLAHAARVVQAAGGVVIADEVQVGLGRTGETFWAFARESSFAPDVVTVGKGLGNGFPVAAVLCTSALAHALERENRELFSTYGGNPAACAAALAVLDVIEEQRLMGNAAAMGRRLTEQCARMGGCVTAVRGCGLFVGIELRADDAPRVARAMLEQHRVLVSLDGPAANVLVVKPPLTWGAAEVDAFCAALRQCASR